MYFKYVFEILIFEILYNSVNVLLRSVVYLSGNGVAHINEVTLRRARLVLGWVTVRGYTILTFNQATQAYSAWRWLHDVQGCHCVVIEWWT